MSLLSQFLVRLQTKHLLTILTGDTRTLDLWLSLKLENTSMKFQRLVLWFQSLFNIYNIKTQELDMLPFIALVKSVMIWLKISNLNSERLSFQLLLIPSLIQFQEFLLIVLLLSQTSWTVPKKNLLPHKSKPSPKNFFHLSNPESQSKKKIPLPLSLPLLSPSRTNSINISTILLTFSSSNSISTKDQTTNNLELKSLKPLLLSPVEFQMLSF